MPGGHTLQAQQQRIEANLQGMMRGQRPDARITGIKRFHAAGAHRFQAVIYAAVEGGVTGQGPFKIENTGHSALLLEDILEVIVAMEQRAGRYYSKQRSKSLQEPADSRQRRGIQKVLVL